MLFMWREALDRPRQFDLGALVTAVIRSEMAATTVKVDPAGPRPFIIVSDSGLVELVLCNGFRLPFFIAIAVEEDGTPSLATLKPIAVKAIKLEIKLAGGHCS